MQLLHDLKQLMVLLTHTQTAVIPCYYSPAAMTIEKLLLDQRGAGVSDL